jgi:REP element-mobilizing transposase RayT
MTYQTVFKNNFIYHVYNRGVRKNKIYLSDPDYRRWEKLLNWCVKYNYSYSLYNNRKKQVEISGGSLENFNKTIDRMYKFEISPVEILAYVEMPNHFHLVLKQITDNGISSFIRRISTGYSMYFNLVYNSKGTLFEHSFKAVLVNTDEQLLQLCRYLHLNPLVANLVSSNKLAQYPWSSFPDYIKNKDNPLLTKKYLLGYFRNSEKLFNFTLAPFQDEAIDMLEGITLDDDYGWSERKKQIKEERRRETLRRLSTL